MDKVQLNMLNDLLVGAFNSVTNIEQKALDNRLTQGLTSSELHTIAAMGLSEENPMSVVAGRLDVTLATLNVAIGKLERKGFVERRRSETDRRQMLVKLTAKGRKAYRAHDAFHRDLITAVVEDMSPEEEQALMNALVKIQNFFAEQNEAE